MTARHHLSAADELLYGAAVFEPHKALHDGRRGHLMNAVYLHSWGAVLALLATGLISGATGAQIPNAATVTYTTATDGVAPINDAGRAPVANFHGEDGSTNSCWVLDAPRNLSLNVTHGSSIVALSCTITGYDLYGQPQTETLAVTATGTSKTAAGKKTWKAIKSIAFTSAGNAQADTANLGWANVLGLPYRVADKNNVIVMSDGAVDTSATVVIADDTSPATATTGAPRGTVAPSVAPNAAKHFAAWVVPSDASSAAGLFGVVPA